jgi:hypothetical protein
MKGLVDSLVREMQAEPWTELWQGLGLRLFHFEDVGLNPTSTDLEIWLRCQAEQLIFITNNRNQDSPDSLEATIRQHNNPSCLPVCHDWGSRQIPQKPSLCHARVGKALRVPY